MLKAFFFRGCLLYTSETEVRKLFDKLKRSFSQSCSDHILRQDISFSGGAVPYKGGSVDKELLISMAEHSLDHAKSLTQGQLVFFSESIAREHKMCIRDRTM